MCDHTWRSLRKTAPLFCLAFAIASSACSSAMPTPYDDTKQDGKLSGTSETGAGGPEQQSGSGAGLPPDTYPGLVERIKTQGPSWKMGGAFAVRFFIEARNLRASAGYISEDGIVRSKAGKDLIVAVSPDGYGTLIFASTKKPFSVGHHECIKSGIVLGLSDGKEFDAEDPDTLFTFNDDGLCEIDIYAGERPSDIQGKFSAKLVSNDKKKYILFESGYFYIKKPPLKTTTQSGNRPRPLPPPPY